MRINSVIQMVVKFKKWLNGNFMTNSAAYANNFRRTSQFKWDDVCM